MSAKSFDGIFSGLEEGTSYSYAGLDAFRVRPGQEAAFERIWSARKPRQIGPALLGSAGFRFYGLLRRMPLPDGPRGPRLYEDEFNYVTFLLWDDHDAVEAYEKTPEVAALTLDTSTLAQYTHQVQPKAMGWDAVISLWNKGVLEMYDNKPMHNHGDVPIAKPAWVQDAMGEGEPVKLPGEAYIVTCVFSVAPDEGHGTIDLVQYGDIFEAMMSIKVLQISCFENVDGFKGFLMLKRNLGSNADPYSEGSHMTVSVWRDEASYKAWQQSEGAANFRWSGFDNQVKLLRPPAAALYDGLLVLESYQGLAGTFMLPDLESDEVETVKPKWGKFGGGFDFENFDYDSLRPKCDDDEGEGKEEGKEDVRARRLAAVSSEEAWFSAWQRDFGCWWGALPRTTQGNLANCLGALSIHLGSRLEGLLRWTPTHAVDGGPVNAEPGCKWIEDTSQLQLPEFPSLGDFEFSLPPIPRLLPPWERLQVHSGARMQRHPLYTPLHPPYTPARGSVTTRAFGMGVGGGLALGAVFALGVARLGCGSSRQRHRASL